MVQNPLTWQHPAGALAPLAGLMLFFWLVWGLPANWFWSLALGLIILPQIAGFATTIYLHRGVTHRAVRFGAAADWGFRFILWLLTSLNRRQWAAVHLKHHAFTDEEGDPHSPRLLGILRVQALNFLYYAREARNPAVVAQWARNVRPPDTWDRSIFEHPQRNYLGLIGGTAALMVLLGPIPGLIAAFLHAMMYVFVLSPSINGLCHWRGYRNFANTATNIQLVAWLTGGEGFHNNHHHRPTSPSFRAKRGEVDLGWIAVLCLKALGAVTFVATTIPLHPRRDTADV